MEQQSAALQGQNMSGTNLAATNLGGTNLAGTNLGGANLGGNNLGGNNLGGNNLGGTNLGGNNLGGNNLGGTNLGGNNLGGNNLGGNNLGGNNLGGSNLGGSDLGGTNLGGNSLSDTNLNGTKLAGARSGSDIHGLGVTMSGMLYSGEDLWMPKTGQCIVLGFGSTAFAKLLGQQSANAKISVALGKLPWGFAGSSGGPVILNAWEAVVWGDHTYCSFVLGAPTDATWPGVAGFIKAVFRWNAPTTQSMEVSGIEASAPYDSTLVTAIITHMGMMNAAAQWRAGTVSDRSFVAGELAFATATTNNQTVKVDFATWVMDSSNRGLILGNVESATPPAYAESIYYTVDNGDGTVGVRIAPLQPWSAGVSSIMDSNDELLSVYQAYQAGGPAKPAARRCIGALNLSSTFAEPLPSGKCDDGIAWTGASGTSGGQAWSTVAGTTAPMNRYMFLPAGGTEPYLRGDRADTMKPVLSETYVHLWDRDFDLGAGTVNIPIDDGAQGSGTNRFQYVGSGWQHCTHCLPADSFTYSYSWSRTKEDYVVVKFTGTRIELYGVKAPNHGIGEISIDGVVAATVDFYSPSMRGNQLLWTSSTMAPGTRTLKLRVTHTKNILSSDYYVAPDAVTITSAGFTIDDAVQGPADNQFNYAGAWTHCTSCGASLYSGSQSSSAVSNDYVKVVFTGTLVKLYGVKGPQGGIGAVSIDGREEDTVDFYSGSTVGNQLLWTSSALAAANHTLKLRVTGLKNLGSAGYYVSPDAVLVTP